MAVFNQHLADILVKKICTLEDRKAQGSLIRVQYADDAGQGRASTTWYRDHVKVCIDAVNDFCTTGQCQVIAAAFWQQIEITVVLMQRVDEICCVFIAISRSVNKAELHTIILGRLECRIQFVVEFAPDNTDGVETKAITSGGGGCYMVGPSAAKSEQGRFILSTGLDKIVFEFAPLVTAELGIGEVLTFKL